METRHPTKNRVRQRDSLTNTRAKDHSTEWVYHTPCHAPASRKIAEYNRLLKTTPRALLLLRDLGAPGWATWKDGGFDYG